MIGLEEIELQDQYGGYWGEHPSYPTSDWRYEVSSGDTREGYWTWVLNRIANDEFEGVEQ